MAGRGLPSSTKACTQASDCGYLGGFNFSPHCGAYVTIAGNCFGVAVNAASAAAMSTDLAPLRATWGQVCASAVCGDPGSTCSADCGRSPGFECDCGNTEQLQCLDGTCNRFNRTECPFSCFCQFIPDAPDLPDATP